MRQSPERLPSIPAIVAAAGGSSRCPGGKLLRSWRGRPLLAWLLETLSRHPGIASILVVTGHDGERVESLLQEFPRASSIYNADWTQGLSSSLRVGVSTLSSQTGFLVALGDTPLFVSRTLSQVLPEDLALEQVRVPTYEGKRGHPVYFPAWTREHWPSLRGDRGASQLMSAWGDRVREIPVEDEEILRDFDSIADFEGAAS